MSASLTDQSFFVSTDRATRRLLNLIQLFLFAISQPASLVKGGGFTFTQEWSTGVPVDQSFFFFLTLCFFSLLCFLLHFISFSFPFLLHASSATSLTWTHSNQPSQPSWQR